MSTSFFNFKDLCLILNFQELGGYMDNVAVGNRIREQRKKMGYTQTKIQQLTGISSGNLSSIENGAVAPSASALYELSRVLNCSIDYLLTGNSSNINNSNSLILKELELELIKRFRLLDALNQEEILEIIQLKIRLRNQSVTNNNQ